MRICSVETREFDADIRALMGRRLKRRGMNGILMDGPDKRCVFARLHDEDMDAWCEAAAEVMLFDLSYFELARMAEELLLPIKDKRAILEEAVRRTRRSGGAQSIARRVMRFYLDADRMNLEGFLRFRMRDVYSAWDMAVMRAAEEQLIKNEYLELMGALNSYVRLQGAKMKEVSVVLNPDGSCTLTDEGNVRIDCACGADEGVVGLLVELAPERIRVFDLSCGKCALLFEVLKRVFSDRIRIF